MGQCGSGVGGGGGGQSNGQGGFKEGDSIHCVGEGGDGLRENFYTSAKHKVKERERTVAGRILILIMN